ncbi:hypothetical protein DFP72DRAFT_1077731 [Ephemerocybe angulata]|uniref:F-box domain-containing protein n=1 Tax=Ephemerocybe angulata TaxID=980116 RepID=A0A8H6LVC8_9AGAR|nr:hypothetical protein DFP72DRAFT_1077731 [Tulosesus angulatus]
MDNVPYELLEKIVALYIEDLPSRPEQGKLPRNLALVDHRTWLAATPPALPDVIRAFPNLNTLSLDFRRYLPVPRPWDPLKTCLLPYPAHLKRLQLDEAPSVDEVAALSASLPSLQFLGVHRVTSQSPPTTTTLHFPALTHLALGDHTFYHRPGKEYGVLMAALAVGGSMPKLETLELLHYSGDPRPLLERFGKQLKSLSYPTRHDDEEELEVPLHLCPDIRTLKLFPYTLVRIHTPMRQLTTVEIVTTDRGRRTPSEAANQLYEQVHRVCRMEAPLSLLGVKDRHGRLSKDTLLGVVAAGAEKQITLMYTLSNIQSDRSRKPMPWGHI